MNRRRALIGLAAVAALALLAVLVPLGLRHVPFFRVRRVELVGVRYLAPDQVIGALGLAPDANLFDPLGPAEERVRSLAGVESVQIDRRLPGTLRVTVVELAPAALVSGPHGMIALDCDARPLPYEPANTALDLPIVQRADSVLARTLCIVRASDSSFYRRVDVAQHVQGGVLLDVGRQRVLLPDVPTSEDIRAVMAVRRQLAATGRAFRELDARFEGWVVARGRQS